MKIVFSDFDGTLTHNGKLGPEFFEIIELIEKYRSELIIVSGRSLSWGHFLLTHFPLKHVIMEGGGVIIHKKIDGVIEEENLVSDAEIQKLADMDTHMRQTHPEFVFSADSFGRRTDRAIEFAQMSDENVEKIQKYLDNHNANYSRSNVHINFWRGEISKSKAVDHFLKKYAPHVSKDECIYYGDALNDESMFAHFPNTVGVSNIISVLDQLQHKPKIVLEGKDNSGYFGVLNHLKDVFDQSVDF